MAEAADEGDINAVQRIVATCWLSTTNPGPYVFVRAEPGCIFDWNRVLKGDLVYTLFQLRRVAVGDEYDFDFKCKHCGKQVSWTQLISKIRVKTLSDEASRHLQTGAPFEAKALDGRAIRYELMTLRREEPMRKLMKQQKRNQQSLADTFAAQSVGIDGLKDQHVKARFTYFDELLPKELTHIKKQFEANDCGLDTEVTVRCTHAECRWVQKIDLPLGAGFFLQEASAVEEEAEILEAPAFMEADPILEEDDEPIDEIPSEFEHS